MLCAVYSYPPHTFVKLSSSVIITDANTKRETGRKAQLSNIQAAKVHITYNSTT